MNILFKFRDGRERFVDPRGGSGTPASIKMAETIERKFDLQWHGGKPVYVEADQPAGSDGEGPIGAYKAAVVKYLEKVAVEEDASPENTSRDVLDSVAREIENDEHLVKFSRLVTSA